MGNHCNQVVTSNHKAPRFHIVSNPRQLFTNRLGYTQFSIVTGLYRSLYQCDMGFYSIRIHVDALLALLSAPLSVWLQLTWHSCEMAASQSLCRSVYTHVKWKEMKRAVAGSIRMNNIQKSTNIGNCVNIKAKYIIWYLTVWMGEMPCDKNNPPAPPPAPHLSAI